MHYICEQVKNEPEKLGLTKLHKILWLTDIYAYRNLGYPVTGETYEKHQYGPYARDLKTTISALEKDGSIYAHTVDYHGFDKQQFVSKKRPDESVFSDKERRLIDDMVKHVCYDHTAATISERTHNELWQIADIHEVIPYEAALIHFVKPDNDDFEWAKKELS